MFRQVIPLTFTFFKRYPFTTLFKKIRIYFTGTRTSIPSSSAGVFLYVSVCIYVQTSPLLLRSK